MVDYYVNKKSNAKLVDDHGDRITELLWGDPVHLASPWDTDSTQAHVYARSYKGWVRKSHLRRRNSRFNGLLEFYIIDVGPAILLHRVPATIITSD